MWALPPLVHAGWRWLVFNAAPDLVCFTMWSIWWEAGARLLGLTRNDPARTTTDQVVPGVNEVLTG